MQEFLNTVPAGAPPLPDLLADLASAQHWATQAVQDWSAVSGGPGVTVEIDVVGLVELRALRDDLRRMIAEGPADMRTAPAVVRTTAATLRMDTDGQVRMEPRGTGWRTMLSMLFAALLQAQLSETSHRLKICRNPYCRTAFYDRSRNNSGVWHDVKTCGNAANLRAYRARQKAQKA
ncbi:CGNR zinc finger domain-containing protein [Streptomyces galbus]|uniref:CGNR zinc finger domain-containing protein n=1 Tax=Streptomyces galbus TaxID=33898 RepID=UPI001E5FD1FD|nr:CGNR zinc finger domain-containing protein [Streptomyces galbus]